MTSVGTEPHLAGSTIDPSTLRRWREQGASVRLLDVRTASEFETGHIPGSVNVPVDRLKPHAEAIASGLNGDRLVVLCQAGPRAERARHILAQHGYSNAVVLTGGVNAWTSAEGDLDQGTPKWTMERQVRLVAGSLVLAGILGSLRYPRLRFLSGAIGAGLTFAAVSNTCAMSRVLGLLPYNRSSRKDVERAVAELTGP